MVGPEAVEYSRRLYDDVLAWYQNADTKAQVVLGLDGAFLAFIAAAAFQKPEDLGALVATFSPWTWGWLALMVFTLFVSMTSAVYCLWSRIYVPSSIMSRVRLEENQPGRTTYAPAVMWFFQYIDALDPKVFRTTLAGVTRPFEVDAMASQITALSHNVRTKHVAVNVGFACAVATLLLCAAAAASHVMSIRR